MPVASVDDPASLDELAATGTDARDSEVFAFNLSDALAQLFVGQRAVRTQRLKDKAWVRVTVSVATLAAA